MDAGFWSFVASGFGWIDTFFWMCGIASAVGSLYMLTMYEDEGETE